MARAARATIASGAVAAALVAPAAASADPIGDGSTPFHKTRFREKRMSTVRILAVDNCGESRRLIAAALGAGEHELRLAGSGSEGVAELQRGAADVLITEVLMPAMDGLEVIKAARRSHPDLWIIAISGGGQYLSADMALTLARAFGADRILYKPFDEAELKAAIEPAEGVKAAS